MEASVSLSADESLVIERAALTTELVEATIITNARDAATAMVIERILWSLRVRPASRIMGVRGVPPSFLCNKAMWR